MRAFLYSLLAWIVPIQAFASSSLKDSMLVDGGTNSANSSTDVNLTDNVLKVVESYLLELVGITAVGVFIYLGWRLFTARGSEEEFKKAWMALAYAAVGLAVMPLAWVAVRVVMGFSVQ